MLYKGLASWWLLRLKISKSMVVNKNKKVNVHFETYCYTTCKLYMLYYM